jgi:flagellar biosynthesis protein FliP
MCDRGDHVSVRRWKMGTFDASDNVTGVPSLRRRDALRRVPVVVSAITATLPSAERRDYRRFAGRITLARPVFSWKSGRARVPILRIALTMAFTCHSLAHAQDRFEPPLGAGISPIERLDVRQPGQRPRGAAVRPAAFEQPVAPIVVALPPATNSLDPNLLASPAGISTSLKVLALMTVLGLVPSILMMTTCFVRFSVVLGLLRQAIGTQHAPPNQVLTALSLFLTFLVMAPVWQRCYEEGIRPYTQPAPGERPLDDATAFERTAAPLRQFMSQQIDRAGNADAIWMLLDFQRPAENSPAASRWHEPQSYDDVPLTVLAPAYLLSELKVAFLIGFQIFLPFLVIDLVVASILTSLGLTMLPPSLISLPFKLLLFVLIDGWFLTVGMLLESVRVT